MHFGSDNWAGAHPQILAALAQASEAGTARAYGGDEWTARVEQQLGAIFEAPCAVFLAPTGTAANGLALAALCRPWQSVLCHEEAHINVDECAAPEHYTGGAKIIGLPGEQAVPDASELAARLARWPIGQPHYAQPGALSLTQLSESGAVLDPDMIARLTEIPRRYNLPTHMDGARFANALAALDCSPAEITWKAGVDILCLGASKGGALACEAVIVFHPDAFPARAEALKYLRKRAGALVSKHRFLAAQMLGWLADDLWLDLAKAANAQTAKLAVEVQKAGLELAWPARGNVSFALLSAQMASALNAAGAVFYPWPGLGPGRRRPTSQEVLARFVTSFETTDAEIAAFGAALAIARPTL